MKHELSTRDLLDRGWTRTLIKRFLPTPDGTAAVAHWANYRGTDTYLATRVWEAEQTADFGQAFLRSWKGRMKGRTAEAALAEMRNAEKTE